MRTTLRSLAISSVVLMLVVGAHARTRPHYGGTVRVESTTAASTAGLVSESLTSIDGAGRVQPLLALRWESQNGTRRWQFWMRANVHFHDGQVVTAAEVAQVLTAKQGTPWRTVRANGTSIVFECDNAQPLLPAILASQDFAITKTDGSGATIGTGPFRMSGSSATTEKLAAFDDYWQGRRYVDALELSGNRGIRDQWMDLGVARAEIVEVPAEQIRHAQQERMRTVVSRNLELIVLVPSQDSHALQDTRLRQAISLAIDRNSLLNVIFQKQGEVAAAVLPNWMTGYDFLFPAQQNLAMAQNLRGQAKQDGALTIGYATGDGTQQLVAERVALNARDAGITMQAVPTGANVRSDLELLRVPLSSTMPSMALRQMTTLLEAGEADPVNDSLDVIYGDERTLLSSYSVIPLLYVPRAYAASPRIRNWSLSADGLPEFISMWVEERR